MRITVCPRRNPRPMSIKPKCSISQQDSGAPQYGIDRDACHVPGAVIAALFAIWQKHMDKR